MRLFAIQTVEQRRRTWTVAARDANAAERAVRKRLPHGARITERAVPVDELDEAASGEEALARLLGTEYLTHEDATMLVEDWVLMARNAPTDEDRAAINARLAPAGLRVAEGSLWIGSAVCIPAMAMIFEGTEWSGLGLGRALRRITGAQTRHMTYAGQRARSIGLPLDVVFAVQPQSQEQSA